MRTNEDPRRISSPHFADLHPVLSKLESLMAEQQAAVDEAQRLSKQVFECAREVDPTEWTSKIEAARDNLDELNRLRVIYDEKALTFMSVFLLWKVAHSRMMDGRKNLSDAIGELLVVHDGIDSKSDDAYLKPVMQARMLRARELHHAEAQFFGTGPRDQLTEMAYEIMVKAFRGLEENLPKARVGLYSSGAKAYSVYTTDLAVEGRKFLPHLNPTVDLRSIRFIPFVDCVNSTHPASARLAELLEELHPQFRVVYGLSELLKKQNGQINEAQHAFRLVQFLHNDEPTAPRCGGNLEQQVEDQDDRRLDYESYRQILHLELIKFGKLLKEIVDTFKASVDETSAMLEEIASDSITTVDRWLTIKIMISNCLATDASLRRYVRDYDELFGVYHKDLSRNAGNRALEASFVEARKHYDGVRRIGELRAVSSETES